VICRSDRRKNDNVLFLTLETVNSPEAVVTPNPLSGPFALVPLAETADSLDVVKRRLPKILPKASFQLVELLPIRADNPYPP
jgi:hypothetical protein